MLQRLLSGNELTGGSPITEEDGNAAINVARQTYSLRLVDVNSTNKGSPAGGIQSFSAMVVVGNHEVRRLAQRCFCTVIIQRGLPPAQSHSYAFRASHIVRTILR